MVYANRNIAAAMQAFTMASVQLLLKDITHDTVKDWFYRPVSQRQITITSTPVRYTLGLGDFSVPTSPKDVAIVLFHNNENHSFKDHGE